VIQVAKEFVEAVNRGKVFVQIPEMVFAKLPCGVPDSFQNGGQCASLRWNPDIGAGLADRGETSAERNFTGDEISATRRATRLGIIVREPHALAREPIQVRCFAGHDTLVVGADVEPAYVIAHDEQDIRFFCLAETG